MKHIVFFFSVFIVFFCNISFGQITITGQEHLLKNYNDAIGKNVTILLNDDDINNLFIMTDKRLKCVTKIFNKSFFTDSLNWLVHGISTHKSKQYLYVSQKNYNIYILLNGNDYLVKMRYFNIYNNLIDILNSQNKYITKNRFYSDFSEATIFDYLLCDTACQIIWTGYKSVNDTILFHYSYVNNNQIPNNNIHEIPASSITEDMFINKEYIEECLLHEQNYRDSLEDEKLHAFLICQNKKTDCDTVFLFNSMQGWHHKEIRAIISPSYDVITFAPDSNYSQLNYEEYLEYVGRRGNKGGILRRNLAKYADSVRSVGYMNHMRELQKEREKEIKITQNNNPLLAKPRINENIKKFISKSAVISNIKGWEYNENTGKWIGSMNHIGGSSSFLSCKSLQLCAFYCNEQKYYALKITVSGGEWRYPALGIDFIPYNEYYLYILDENDVNSLKTPKELASLVQSSGRYDYENYNENHTENMIVRELENCISPNKRSYIWTQKSGNYIRFNFNTFSAYDDYDKWYYERVLKKSFDPTEQIKDEVKSRYFEVSASEWKKLFTVVK